MERSTVLRVGIVAALVAGLGSVVFGGPLATTIGVVSIILSLMGLMPLVKGFVAEQRAA